MKINVEIDLNDIWPEFKYDSELGHSPEITLGHSVEAAIAEEVKNKIWNLVQDSVDKK